MKKEIDILNFQIRSVVEAYVRMNTGIETVKVIDYIMDTMSLIISTDMKEYLTRERVSGNISALVEKFKTLDCKDSCLYVI